MSAARGNRGAIVLGRLHLPSLGDGTFLLLLSIVVGLAFGSLAEHTKPLLVPLLAVAMTFSTISVPSSALLDVRGLSRPTIVAIVCNYLVQTVVLLAAARWFTPTGDLWIGCVLIAATPPAISIITITDVLRGNTTFSLIGVVGGYLAAFVIVPIIALLLLGQSVINPVDLLVILGELVLLPLVLSRLLIHTGVSRRIDGQRSLIANVCLSITSFTMVGLNRDVLLSQFDILAAVAAVGFLSTFVLGHVIEFALRPFHIDTRTVVSVILISTMKNTSMASAIGISLFSVGTAIPAAVLTTYGNLYFVWLKYWLRRINRAPLADP